MAKTTATPTAKAATAKAATAKAATATATAKAAAQQAAVTLAPAHAPMPYQQGPRASRAACHGATTTFVQQALAAGGLPTGTLVKLGVPYVAKGGQPDGQRASLVAAVQAALASGPITWGQLAQTGFSFRHRTLGTVGQRIKAHLPFLLGNGIIAIA